MFISYFSVKVQAVYKATSASSSFTSILCILSNFSLTTLFCLKYAKSHGHLEKQSFFPSVEKYFQHSKRNSYLCAHSHLVSSVYKLWTTHLIPEKQEMIFLSNYTTDTFITQTIKLSVFKRTHCRLLRTCRLHSNFSNSLIIHAALTQPEHLILVRWMGLETQ